MATKIVAVVVVVVIIAAAACVVVFTGDDDDDYGTPVALADAELKVYGNINGDRYLDENDVTMIQGLIDDGYTAEDYPLADANQDGVLDSKDITVVQNVVDGKETTIWHINYHDTNDDGIMDEELVSTTFPVSSIICTGSTNTFLILMMLGIVDEVKGSSYSSSTDSTLFGTTYLDESKVVKLGTSSTSITFEDGKAGSSDVIAEEGVTMVLSDWNRTYLTNESDFEGAGIDVVRVAAASTDREVMTHSAALLCLLFQKGDRVDTYLDLCFEVMDYVEDAVEGEAAPKAVASSMTGYLSSESSDYAAVVVAAGATFGIDGVAFGGSTSLKIVDHPEVYTYDFEYIIHLRTGLSYGQTAESNAELWQTYTSAFSDWQYADSGQYIVSGSIPVPLRIAYTACALHSDVVNIDVVDDYHQKFVNLLYGGLDFDISSMSFLLGPEDEEEIGDIGTSVDSPLMIRGNANNDYTIDELDMNVVKAVMNGKLSLADYPLADVNGDGTVDSTDVSILQDMIDRKEGTTVYVISLDTNGNETTVPVTYPLRNIVSYTTNIAMPIVYAGGGQYVAGYFVMSYDNAQASISSTAVDLGGSSRSISDTAWTNFTNLDATLGESGEGVGAFILSYDGIAQITDARYADLQTAGIPLLCWAAADAAVETQVVVTLSYLFGTETESIGAQYASLYDDVLSQLDEKLESLTDDEKTTFIAFTMYIYICQTGSTFNNTANTAYGLQYSEVNSEFASTYEGTGSTKMASVEALSNYTDVGALINNRSIDWVTSNADIESTVVSTWDHDNSGTSSAAYFEGFEDKLVYVNNLLPGPAKLAYVAAALYPDDFTYEWAADILQQCIDMGLIPLQGYTVDQLVPYFDYAVYQSYTD